MFTRHLIYLSFFLLLVPFSKNIYAQTFSLPSTSTTGTYAIGYSASGTMGVIQEWNGSAWISIGGGQKNGSVSVTKTTSGTYSYQMLNCTVGQSGASCYPVPGTKTITVTLTPPVNPIVCTGSANTITYCYDDLGRVKTVIHPNGVKNNYEYDAADNRTKKESTN